VKATASDCLTLIGESVALWLAVPVRLADAEGVAVEVGVEDSLEVKLPDEVADSLQLSTDGVAVRDAVWLSERVADPLGEEEWL